MLVKSVRGLRRKAVVAGAVCAAAAVVTACFVVLAPTADAAETPNTHAIYNDPTGDDTAKNRIFTLRFPR